MRQIVLDTETTGLEPSQDHRIIEIGAVEIIDRQLTGNHFHIYLQPDREIDEGALQVHGISNEFLTDKPRFPDVVDDFLSFVHGAELVIHNAPFDVGFINHELKRMNADVGRIESICSILDSLALARQMHPGQKNSLDALCKRYEVDNSSRTLHGALLDSEILADVYLMMTGGQTALSLDSSSSSSGKQQQEGKISIRSDRPGLKIIRATESELKAHEDTVAIVDKVSGGNALFKTLH